MGLLRASVVAILPLVAACAAGSSAGKGLESTAWSTRLHRSHPLVGRIWDVRQQRFVGIGELEQSVAKSDFVLLGETHDNADHHVLQAQMVRAAASSRRPALAFEMLDTSQQAMIDEVMARAPPDPEAIAEAVQWSRSGWPAFELYRPVFAAGFDAGLKFVAANLPREQVRRVVRGGAAELDAAVRDRIDREGPLPPEAIEALRKEMRDAHCGELPEQLIDPLILAQRARDAQMAMRVRGSAAGAVLIAGAGHVRTDYGVAALLEEDEPGRRVVSVAFLEVSPDWRAPQAYGKRYGQGALPFDFVVFTPAAEREDPCEALRRPK